MLSAGGLTLLVRHLYDSPGPLTIAETVVVPKGFSSSEIADASSTRASCRAAGPSWSTIWLRAASARRITLRHGEYLFKPDVSIREVLDPLAEGKSVLYKVTIPEGLTSHQIVERLKGEENLSGEVTQVPAEGSLLPETYSIEKGMSRQELLQIMQAKQTQALERVGAPSGEAAV